MARRVTGGRVRAVDDSDDPLSAAVGHTRRLGANQKRVVLRLRRCDEGESAPWVTETVCFFFNAQGEVLRAHRAGDDKLKAAAAAAVVRRGDVIEGNEGEDEQDPIIIRSFSAKDAIEKERVTLWLADLHPSVEVVGFMVSYTTDQIARRPHLNAFDVTCDATTDGDEEEDPDVRVSTLLHRETAPAYVFTYTHDRPVESGANYVVLFKMYRDTDSRNDWFLHSIGATGEVRSSVNAALAEAMQVFLLDIIPEIEIAHRNALNTVASICAALNRNEVLEIEQYFREEGVSREEFTKLLLLVLLMSRPDLHRLSRVTALIALLFEMFEQIDINGDGAVDWEEFTTFCVSLGLIATKDQPVQGSISSSHSYHQQLVGPYNRSFPYQIRCIRPLPSLRIVTVIQNKCSIVLVYDTDMNFLYEFTHVSRLCHEDNEALAILDLDYIPMRNWMVVSSSDHSLTFWSVVNAITGAYVFAFKIGSRCPIPHLQWCGNSLNRLFTISSEGVQLWDIEAKRVASRMNHHRDRITACVEIQGEELLLATCSFDTTIAVLHVPSLTIAFHLNGHIQGVQQMDYHQRGGLLLSAGFEHQAYCWSIPGQCLVTTLGGHQASLIGARYVSHPMDTTTVMAVVGDERGHFRLWDISRCLGGHSTDLATPVQSFDIVTPNLCRFRSFACVTPPQGKKKKRSGSSELFDVVSGSFRLFRFHAVAQSDESAPPRHVTFNSVSNSFVGSVDGVITVWAGNSGLKLEEPITIRDSDVCAIAFDMPRERKLFVATSDGAIRLYNPITAMLLTKTLVHDGLISSLIYCSRSACLISTGYDRRISIAHSSAGKTDIDVLRSVENAHDSCITVTAYSPSLELIATGDDAGNIHVYDFQRLYLLFRCEGHLDEIRALQFHHSAPTLFSGDAKGVVFVWHVATSDTSYQIQPTMQLNLVCSNFFLTECRPSSVSGSRSSRPTTAIKQPAVITPSPVTSIVCTPESKHATSSYVYVGTVNGAIWGWDFRALTNHARKFGVGKGFEYRFQESRSVDTGSKYNAMLRVTHKTSVLKLRAEDVSAPTMSGIGRSGRAGLRGAGSDVLESCEASCVWQAHSSMITQLRELPYPGQLYSVSLDGTIKVWDMTHSCLGTITTIADPNRLMETTLQGSTTSTTPTGGSSTWKYAYHHHLVHEARDQHVRIGREMMQRVRRKLKKAQERNRGTQFAAYHPLKRQEEDPEFAIEKAGTPELTPVLAAAEKLLAGQFAFSKESRRIGMQSGLFGTEEARLLRDLSQGPRKQHEQQVKSRLAPLMLASPKPESHKKKSKNYPQGNEHELPVMRTMKHFPGEVDRRRATERRAPARAEPPDISLSPFLREKLFSTADGWGLKSAPKKRPPTHSLSLRMDASVVVTENVGLPLLQQNQSQPLLDEPTNDGILKAVEESARGDGSQRRLASVASAPSLSGQQYTSLSLMSSALTASSSMDANDQQSAMEKGPARVNNIERKMRLYEGLGVVRMISRDDGPSDRASVDFSSRQQRRPHRQRSQPLLPVRQKAEVDAVSGSLNARKRLSQGEVGPVAGSPIANPYGPYYTMKQVVDFSAIIARFDADYSGDIDKSEWVHMMQSCKPIFGAADLEAAERLFHSIDRDDSGKISLQEILPMVFSKATPDQLQKMRQSIQARIDKAAAAMATGKVGDV